MSMEHWIQALGKHFFRPGQAGRQVSLYLDRKLLEEIGQGARLGGWEAFWRDLRSTLQGPQGLRKMQHPLEMVLSRQREWEFGGLLSNEPQRDFPPLLLGLALLVLAWTEAEESWGVGFYRKLEQLIQFQVSGCKAMDRHGLEAAAKAIIDGMAKVDDWLKEVWDGSRGRLEDHWLTAHKWVGRIRFHSLLDLETRRHLVGTWKELRLIPHESYTPEDLLAWWRKEIPNRSEFTSLYRALAQEDGELIVAHLLHQCYLEWEGEGAVKTNPRRNPAPQIRLRFRQDGSPLFVHINRPQSLNPWKGSQGESYVVKDVDKDMGQLYDQTNGAPVRPTLYWMFEDIVLSGERNIQRKSRSHFWLVENAAPGYFGTYLEQPNPITNLRYLLFVKGEALQMARDWVESLGHGDTAGSWLMQGEDYCIIKGKADGNCPLQTNATPSKASQGPRLIVSQDGRERSSCSTIRVIHVRSEESDLPLQSVELQIDQKRLVFNCLDDGGFELRPVPSFPKGFGKIHARFEDGTTVDRTIHLRTVEPSEVDWTALVHRDANGDIVRRPQEQAAKGWLHHSPVGDFVYEPGIAWWRVVQTPSALTVQEMRFCDHLLALADGKGSVELADIQNAFLSSQRRALLAHEEKEFLANMESLGFWEYMVQARKYVLGAMRMVRLPDDYYRIRVALLGMISTSVIQVIENWTRHNDHTLRFEWIRQSHAHIPPILCIHATDDAHVRQLILHLQSRFVGAMQTLLPEDTASVLLKWLPPMRALDALAVPEIDRSLFFPRHAEWWDSRKQAWQPASSAPSFPTLSRVPIAHYRSDYAYIWWENEMLGIPATRHLAMPQLLLRHRLPWIAADNHYPSRILVVGRHRLPTLLERGLVLASARLPVTIKAEQIPAWSKLFDPAAPVRVFEGIRYPLRIQLLRLIQPWLALSQSTPTELPTTILPEATWKI